VSSMIINDRKRKIMFQYITILTVLLSLTTLSANNTYNSKSHALLLKKSGCDKKIKASLTCIFKKSSGQYRSHKKCPKISKRCEDIFEGKVKK